MPTVHDADSPIPSRAGIGLKARHCQGILDRRPDIGWFEIHPENYFGAGGPPHRYLTAIRRDFPVSFHCVGLSLGSADPADPAHLRRLRELADRYQPALVSDHLSWSSVGGTYMNDLLPLPYTGRTLDLICDRVGMMQDRMARRILLENPSTYLRFAESTIPEPDFLAAVARRTGCGILLDVNNAYVSALNHGDDPARYLDAIPAALIGEIHLAGHHVERRDGVTIRIDDHGSAVCRAVWDLYRALIGRAGPRPTLVEWDNAVPDLAVLVDEATKADIILHAAVGSHAA